MQSVDLDDEEDVPVATVVIRPPTPPMSLRKKSSEQDLQRTEKAKKS